MNPLHYKRAIELLSTMVDFKDVVFKIAALNPEIIVNVFDGEMLDRIAKVYVAQGKIAAIKEHRFINDSSLLDAKTAVERLALERGLNTPT